MSRYRLIAPRGVTELSFVASAQGGNTVTIPASAQAGDLAVLKDFGQTGSVSVATPAGWTEIDTAVYGGLGSSTSRISYKLLEEGDPGAAISGISADTEHRQMFVFRPDEEIEAIEFTTPNRFVGTSNPPNQAVNAAGEQAPGVVFGASSISNPDQLHLASTPAFTTIIQRNGSGITAGGSAEFGYRIYNEAPADHEVSTSGTGVRILQSLFLRVS